MNKQHENEFKRIIGELIKVDKFVYDNGFKLRGIAVKTILENLWLRVKREEQNNDK